MRYFTVNNAQYKAKEIDFNTICEMEEYGVNLNDISSIKKKSMSLSRAYLAVCSGMTIEQAGAEIQAHVIAGGDLGELNEAFADMFGKSDFFLAVIEKAKQAMEQSEKPKRTKKQETE